MATLSLQPLGPSPTVAPTVETRWVETRWHIPPPTGRGLLLLSMVGLLAGSVTICLWSAYILPITVQIAPTAAAVREQVFGLGTVGARVQSNVGFKVAGVLVALNADMGDRVPTGAKCPDAVRRGLPPSFSS